MDSLRALGLDEKEQRVYLATLKNTKSTAREISEEAGVSRELTYHVLERLEKRGLITRDNTENVIQFQAIHPKRLLNIIEEKQELIKQELPHLINIYNQSKKKDLNIRTYRGKEGLKAIGKKIIDMHPAGIPLRGYGKAGALDDALKWTMQHLIRERVKKDIQFQGIYYKADRAEEKKQLPNVEVRILDQEAPAPTFTFIYPGAIAIAILEDEPVTIEIESESAYKAYKEQFEILWEHAK